MNEASGTRTDSHGTNHLTDNNTVGSTTGKQGNAALFALASSEYLSIPDNASLSMWAGARMTVCTWVKLNSKTSPQIQEFVAKSGSTNGSWEYFLRYDGLNDRFEFVVTSDGTSTTQLEANANTFGSPSINTWYFLCGGYDGTNIWVSVNAGARDTVAYSADIYDGSSSNALQVGRYAGGSQYLNGALDEALIYKRSLNAGEISWLYNGGLDAHTQTSLPVPPPPTPIMPLTSTRWHPSAPARPIPTMPMGI